MRKNLDKSDVDESATSHWLKYEDSAVANEQESEGWLQLIIILFTLLVVA